MKRILLMLCRVLSGFAIAQNKPLQLDVSGDITIDQDGAVHAYKIYTPGAASEAAGRRSRAQMAFRTCRPRWQGGACPWLPADKQHFDAEGVRGGEPIALDSNISLKSAVVGMAL